MTEETLQKANVIKEQIEFLRKEIEEFPRYILHPKDYEETGHGYVKRILERYKYKLRVPKGYYVKDLEFELSEEDLQALVGIRKRKVEELLKELEKLS